MATERPQHSLPTHARPPRYHRCPPLCADGARHNERSPWCRPFPPDSPPTISRLCSNPSRVLWPTPTPPPRTRGSFGLGLHPPACFAGGAEVSRFSRGEFPDVHGFYRPRRAHTSLAKARRVMWPSPSVHRVGARNSVFRGSMAGPPVPLSTLHPRCRHRRRMTRGQRGSLLLHCGAPSSPTLRRFYPGAFGQPQLRLIDRVHDCRKSGCLNHLAPVSALDPLPAAQWPGRCNPFPINNLKAQSAHRPSDPRLSQFSFVRTT